MKNLRSGWSKKLKKLTKEQCAIFSHICSLLALPLIGKYGALEFREKPFPQEYLFRIFRLIDSTHRLLIEQTSTPTRLIANKASYSARHRLNEVIEFVNGLKIYDVNVVANEHTINTLSLKHPSFKYTRKDFISADTSLNLAREQKNPKLTLHKMEERNRLERKDKIYSDEYKIALQYYEKEEDAANILSSILSAVHEADVVCTASEKR